MVANCSWKCFGKLLNRVTNYNLDTPHNLSDDCIAHLWVAIDFIFNPVGRLLQLLHAPQIWALHVDQWMWMLCRNKGLCLWPSDEATDPRMMKSYKSEGGSTVHQTQISAAAILTLRNLHNFCCRTETKCHMKKHVGSSYILTPPNLHVVRSVLLNCPNLDPRLSGLIHVSYGMMRVCKRQ